MLAELYYLAPAAHVLAEQPFNDILEAFAPRGGYELGKLGQILVQRDHGFGHGSDRTPASNTPDSRGCHYVPCPTSRRLKRGRSASRMTSTTRPRRRRGQRAPT